MTSGNYNCRCQFVVFLVIAAFAADVHTAVLFKPHNGIFEVPATSDYRSACPDLFLEYGTVEFNENRTLANFSCNWGYRLVGNDESVCNQGNWSHPVPKCIVPCSDIDLENGRATVKLIGLSSMEFGVIFKCYSGYRLVGSSLSICEPGNNTIVPKCVPGSGLSLENLLDPAAPFGSCPVLVLEHGKVKMNEDRFVATFSCDFSYRLVGNEDSFCIQGNWSHPVPKCIAPCSEIVLEHGTVSLLPPYTNSANFYLEFKCDAGYGLIGNDRSVCLFPNNAEVPKCVRTCPDLVLENGQIQINNDRTVATFSCYNGYLLVGDGESFCNQRNWSHPVPKCVAPCLDIVLEHGTVSVEFQDNFFSNFYVDFKCDDGYDLMGRYSSKCQSDNRTIVPTCVPKTNSPQELPESVTLVGTCLDLDLQNGRVEYLENKTSANFSCNQGYIRIGNDESACHRGTWERSLPKCLGPCPGLSLENGSIEYYDYEDAVLATFSCDYGYLRVGSDESVCNGEKWSNSLPECIVPCRNIVLKHGKATLKQDYADPMHFYFLFECDAGYQLLGDNVCDCKNGSATKVPKCVRTPLQNPFILFAPYSDNACPDLDLKNGKVDYLKDKTLANFSCNQGYVRVGNYESTCYGGNWHRSPPKCLGPCPDLYLENGSIEYYDYEDGVLATFSCDYGYLRVGNDESVCNGEKWSNSVPECIVPCKNIVLKHGKATLKQDYADAMNFYFLFECDAGYLLIGDNVSDCVPGNTTKVPKCVYH